MSKILSVFGATGGQGRSVVEAVLADGTLSAEFRIRGIARDVSKPVARELSARGVEMVQADMLSKDSVRYALKGSHTVFLMTAPVVNQWDLEKTQGKNVADVSEELGVEHLIFSSLLSVAELSNGERPNVHPTEAKAEVERYIRAKNIPSSFVLTGVFMHNFILPPWQNFRKGDDGTLVWTIPGSSEAKIPLIDNEKDVGKYVVGMMKSTPEIFGKRVLASVDYYTPTRIISEFQEITGKPVRLVQKADWDTFMKWLPPPVGPIMFEIESGFDGVGYYAGESLEESLNILAKSGSPPTTWKDFVKENIAAFP
ncbi:hypothetical protein KVR01_005921 [Diaporthe batatas]|uniref:uncharacterized protein n=1 Tax=Diaporthe batatas TaxID=748121 RepID=UPI001D040936|nr:uncharacterized protein KVR01_005921 [Diaporthe batatas]KAG8164003.1 hypothetical protein KVR01_005921 [Diaporthe batatas]